MDTKISPSIPYIQTRRVCEWFLLHLSVFLSTLYNLISLRVSAGIVMCPNKKNKKSIFSRNDTNRLCVTIAYW